MDSITFATSSRHTANSYWQEGYKVGIAAEASQRRQVAIRWASAGFFAALGMAFVIAIVARAAV